VAKQHFATFFAWREIYGTRDNVRIPAYLSDSSSTALNPNCLSCCDIHDAISGDFASTTRVSGPQAIIFIFALRQDSRACGSQSGALAMKFRRDKNYIL
jgi:hypothetical protein